MNTGLIIAQLKRELWENKISFLIAPSLVTALLLIVVLVATLYAGGVVNKNGVHFNTTSNGVPIEAGIRLANDDQQKLYIASQGQEVADNFDAVTSVTKDAKAFDGMITGSMYANCVLLYIIFSIVTSAYSLRCLFDDRKNRDILFWRSMPVSETTTVLVKLAMVIAVMPAIMLLLNIVVTLLVIFLGVVFFSYFGVPLSLLISSIAQGQSLYLPLQIFYELVFALLMLLPVFGFALLASAWAKRSPFFLFASPAVLALADMLLQKFVNLNIGILGFFSLYFSALVNVRSAFVLQEALVFEPGMLLPLVTCVGVGAALIAAAIWLRNNRYEI